MKYFCIFHSHVTSTLPTHQQVGSRYSWGRQGSRSYHPILISVVLFKVVDKHFGNLPLFSSRRHGGCFIYVKHILSYLRCTLSTNTAWRVEITQRQPNIYCLCGHSISSFFCLCTNVTGGTAVPSSLFTPSLDYENEPEKDGHKLRAGFKVCSH